METIADYARGGGRHFVRLDEIPVVSPETTVSDGLALMKAKGIRAILIRDEANRYRLVLDGHLNQVAFAPHSIVPKFDKFLDMAAVVHTIDASRTTADAHAALRNEPDFQVLAVLDAGELIGVCTKAEDWRRMFVAPPSVYSCTMGHHWPPPPPQRCPIDQTPVSAG